MIAIVKFLLGFMWGTTLGMAVVLLTTPKNGEEFRAELVQWFEGTKEEWQQLREERRAQLQQQLVNLKGGNKSK